jgi:hypothetical protein
MFIGHEFCQEGLVHLFAVVIQNLGSKISCRFAAALSGLRLDRFIPWSVRELHSRVLKLH